jgi:hypothetical protein
MNMKTKIDMLIRISARDDSDKKPSTLSDGAASAAKQLAFKIVNFIEKSFGGTAKFLEQYEAMHKEMKAQKAKKAPAKASISKIYVYQIRRAGITDFVTQKIQAVGQQFPFLAKHWKVIIVVLLIAAFMAISESADAAGAQTADEILAQAQKVGMGTNTMYQHLGEYIPSAQLTDTINDMTSMAQSKDGAQVNQLFSNILTTVDFETGKTAIQSTMESETGGKVMQTWLKQVQQIPFGKIFDEVIAPRADRYFEYFQKTKDSGVNDMLGHAKPSGDFATQVQQLIKASSDAFAQSVQDSAKNAIDMCEHIGEAPPAGNDPNTAGGTYWPKDVSPNFLPQAIRASATNQLDELAKKLSELAVNYGKGSGDVQNILYKAGENFWAIAKNIKNVV